MSWVGGWVGGVGGLLLLAWLAGAWLAASRQSACQSQANHLRCLVPML